MRLDLQKTDLAKLTTFGIGGKTSNFKTFTEVNEIDQVVDYAKKKRLKIYPLGGGSNVLIGKNIANLFFLKSGETGYQIREYGRKSMQISVAAGENWDQIVKFAVAKKLSGIECLSGIPGTIGAAPIQNIGAYGQQLEDVFVKLSAYDFLKKKVLIFKKAECKFAYRDSIFKNEAKGRYFVINVTLKLFKESKSKVNYQSLQKYFDNLGVINPNSATVRKAVLQIRKNKLDDPNRVGNAGSFFKNPLVTMSEIKRLLVSYPDLIYFSDSKGMFKVFAGWLIEHVGLKGYNLHNVGVSEKHALIIINRSGKADAKEVVKFAKMIQNAVYQAFKIKLEPEVQFVGV